MRKKVGIIKRMFCLLLIFLLSINSFAAIVSDNDGSAFITKAEFDALKSSFQSQIDTYNQSIDSKIDGAIASYLAGIKLSTTQELTSWLQKLGTRKINCAPFDTHYSRRGDNNDCTIIWLTSNCNASTWESQPDGILRAMRTGTSGLYGYVDDDLNVSYAINSFNPDPAYKRYVIDKSTGQIIGYGTPSVNFTWTAYVMFPWAADKVCLATDEDTYAYTTNITRTVDWTKKGYSAHKNGDDLFKKGTYKTSSNTWNDDWYYDSGMGSSYAATQVPINKVAMTITEEAQVDDYRFHWRFSGPDLEPSSDSFNYIVQVDDGYSSIAGAHNGGILPRTMVLRGYNKASLAGDSMCLVPYYDGTLATDDQMKVAKLSYEYINSQVAETVHLDEPLPLFTDVMKAGTIAIDLKIKFDTTTTGYAYFYYKDGSVFKPLQIQDYAGQINRAQLTSNVAKTIKFNVANNQTPYIAWINSTSDNSSQFVSLENAQITFEN